MKQSEAEPKHVVTVETNAAGYIWVCSCGKVWPSRYDLLNEVNKHTGGAMTEAEPKRCLYDPPEGWKYGFPKPYQPLAGESLADTLRRDGYPEHLIRLKQGLEEWTRFIEISDSRLPNGNKSADSEQNAPNIPVQAPAEGAALFRQQAKELAELCEKLRPGTGAAIETFVNMAYEEGAEPRYDLLTDWRDLAAKNLETAQQALKVIEERDNTIASLREQLAQAQRERDEVVRKWVESQKIVHYGQFHQWKWGLCDKAECKSAREALARTSEEGK